MTVYYILVVVPMILSIYAYIDKRDIIRRYAIGSFFLIFLLILIFRDESIGCDLVNYHSYFDYWSAYRGFSGLDLLETEIGFAYFSKFISLFTNDFQVYIGVIAFISVIPFMILYIKKSENPILSMTLFLSIGVFAIFFSGMRQIIAMSMIPLIYYYVIKKKRIYFLITVALATLFHTSAIVLLLMYPVYYMRLTNKWLIPILVALTLVFMLRDVIWTNTLSAIGGRYEEMYGDIDDSGAIMMFLLTLLFLLYSYLIPDTKLLNGDIIGMRNFLILCVFIESFSGVSNIVMRMNHYYSVFIPLLIPMISNRSAKGNKVFVEMAVAIMIVFFIYRFFNDAYYGEDIVQIFPYKSFLTSF